MLLTRTRWLRGDRGVTLPEVLITIVILGIIIVPLGNAIISMIRLTDDTSRRLNESHDAQILTAYFASDVAAMGTRDWTDYPYPLRQSVELNAPANGGLYPCGVVGSPNAVVRLAWDDPISVDTQPRVVRVAYVVMTAGGERQLHRITCLGSAVPIWDIVVAHNLDTTNPTVTCSAPCASAPAVPATVTMTVAIRNSASRGPGLTVVLTGQRRQS